MVIVPVRTAPVLVSTVKFTDPFPLPVAPDVTVIQGTLLTASQRQPLCVDTVIVVPVPPDASMFWLVGEIVESQVGVTGPCPRCDTNTCCPLTTIVPSREAVLSLRATLNVMVALPLPDAGDNPEIQLTAVEASHAHSASAVRLMLPRPPPASTVGGEPNETSQLSAVGAEDTLEEDSHPPIATAATTNSMATAER
jgi:hypothetical protein